MLSSLTFGRQPMTTIRTSLAGICKLLRTMRVEGILRYATSCRYVHPDDGADDNQYGLLDRLQPEDLDLSYLTDEESIAEMRNNIARRKGVGDVDLVKQLHDSIFRSNGWTDERRRRQFMKEALRIPNRCRPDSLQSTTTTVTNGHLTNDRSQQNTSLKYEFVPNEFHAMAEATGYLRRSGIGALVGGRAYYLIGALAQIEDALCKYTIQFLESRKFNLVVVPDILYPDVIEACGMNTEVERTQLYSLDRNHYGRSVCLSGTSEMALAALHSDEIIDVSKLPLKYCAVSRCFRAETSRLKEESGIFRVHQFTKVEMFSLTANETGTESAKVLNDFVSIQKQLFASLGLQFQVLDMPSHEMGAAAYRKYDIEAWMPGRQAHGEISSSSNCTDYQSRRLKIRYCNKHSESSSGNDLKYVHTVNGTACAVPRMLIAMLETHQRSDGSVGVPEVLRPYFHNQEVFTPCPLSLKVLRSADGSY